jgi:hypothetical protein
MAGPAVVPIGWERALMAAEKVKERLAGQPERSTFRREDLHDDSGRGS